MKTPDRGPNGRGYGAYAERIERLLERKPLDMDRDTHRKRVSDLMSSLGELSFFEILDVGPGARDEEVHGAYLDLARLVHPLHAEKLGLPGGRAALEILFDRVTEAYRTLSDPDRYRTYLESHPESAWTATHPRGEAREEETRREAARQYAAATHFAADGLYHDAIETLEQALRLDERPEYYGLLAQCEAQNPNWRARAVANFQRAIALAPEAVEYRLDLARIFEANGQRSRVRQLVQEVLSLDPANEDALDLKERMGGSQGGKDGDSSFFGRLFKRGAPTDDEG